MYSSVFVAPGHGGAAPLAAGLALLAALSTGGWGAWAGVQELAYVQAVVFEPYIHGARAYVNA